MKNDNQRLWDMVNSIDIGTKKALQKLREAEEAIRKADNITIEDFDDLMIALSYLYREFHRNNR